MPNNIEVNIIGRDNLTAEMDRASLKVEQRAARLRNQVGSQFKNLAANMVGSVSGGAGQIVGSLGSIRHPAAIAVAAIAGVGIAFVGLAKRSAELTLSINKNDQQSKEFLNGIKNLQVGFENLVVSVGQKVIPVFLKLFDLLGIETKQAGKTREEIVKLREEQKKHADEVSKKYAELNEQARIAFGEGNREKIAEIVLAIADLRSETGTANDTISTLSDGMVRIRVTTTAAESAFRSLAEAQSKIGAGEDTFTKLLKRMAANYKLIEGSLQRTAALIADIERDDFVRTATYEKQTSELSKHKELIQDIASATFQAAQNSQNWFDILSSVAQTALRIFLATQGVPVPSFGPAGANGLIAMQQGSIVRRPTRALIGEAGPEAVVPLSPSKSRQRDAVMQAAGLNNNQTNNINLVFPNAQRVDDPVFLRNKVFPAINRELRRGGGSKMLSSNTL